MPYIQQTLHLRGGGSVEDSPYLRNQPVTEAEANRWITLWSELLSDNRLPNNIERIVCVVK